MLFSLFSALASVASIAQAATLNVTVGGPGGLLAFVPNQLNASAGDVVQFTFVAGNHSVVQSSFATPCAAASGAFNSGFEFIGNSTNYLNYNLTINGTDPVYIYCSQGVHCARGMVLAINTSPSNFTTFQAAANATAATTPTSNTTSNTTSPSMSTSGSASGTASSAASSSKAAAFKLVSSAGMVVSVAGFFAVAL